MSESGKKRKKGRTGKGGQTLYPKRFKAFELLPNRADIAKEKAQKTTTYVCPNYKGEGLLEIQAHTEGPPKKAHGEGVLLFRETKGTAPGSAYHNYPIPFVLVQHGLEIPIPTPPVWDKEKNKVRCLGISKVSCQVTWPRINLEKPGFAMAWRSKAADPFGKQLDQVIRAADVYVPLCDVGVSMSPFGYPTAGREYLVKMYESSKVPYADVEDKTDEATSHYPKAGGANVFANHREVLRELHPSFAHIWTSYAPEWDQLSPVDGFDLCRQYDVTRTHPAVVPVERKSWMCGQARIAEPPKTKIFEAVNWLCPLNKLVIQCHAICNPPIGIRVFDCRYPADLDTRFANDPSYDKGTVLFGTHTLESALRVEAQFEWNWTYISNEDYVKLTGINMVPGGEKFGETITYGLGEVVYATRDPLTHIISLNDSSLQANPVAIPPPAGAVKLDDLIHAPFALGPKPLEKHHKDGKKIWEVYDIEDAMKAQAALSTLDPTAMGLVTYTGSNGRPQSVVVNGPPLTPRLHLTTDPVAAKQNAAALRGYLGPNQLLGLPAEELGPLLERNLSAFAEMDKHPHRHVIHHYHPTTRPFPSPFIPPP